MRDWLLLIKKYDKYILVSVCCIVGMTAIYFIFLRQPSDNTPPSLVLSSTENQAVDSNQASSIEESALAYADIKGAVKRPGMYQLKANMRLIDLVKEAGGFLDQADQKRINLALVLEDQMVVYIPEQGEELVEELSSAAGDSETNQKGSKEDGKINLNTASVEELQQLNGIGQKKAEKIIQHREEVGSFRSIEDLKEVSGIGEKTFERLKESITI